MFLNIKQYVAYDHFSLYEHIYIGKSKDIHQYVVVFIYEELGL